MFGFLKPRPAPEGPVTFDFDIEIAAAPAQVYALVDWADPRNAQRQKGHRIAAVDGAPGAYTMVMEGLPGHVMEIAVTDTVPHERYGFQSSFRPGVGRLVTAHEDYTFEATDDGGCVLRLVTTATFIEKLRMKHFQEELFLMSLASHNALAKLKLLAEEGIDAVMAVDEQIVVGCGDQQA